MTYLLKSTARGRGALILRKLLLAAGMTTLVWAVVYGMEVYALLSSFDIPAWSAPAKNLSMLTAFPLNCSIILWLVLLYTYRWLSLFCGAVIVLFLSSRVKRLEVAYISASAVMLIPSVLSAYMGIGALRPMSITLPVAAMPLLLSANDSLTRTTLAALALLVIAAVSTACISIQAKGKNRKSFL